MANARRSKQQQINAMQTLLQQALTAFNELPNRRLRYSTYQDTYAIVDAIAELQRIYPEPTAGPVQPVPERTT